MHKRPRRPVFKGPTAKGRDSPASWLQKWKDEWVEPLAVLLPQGSMHLFWQMQAFLEPPGPEPGTPHWGSRYREQHPWKTWEQLQERSHLCTLAPHPRVLLSTSGPVAPPVSPGLPLAGPHGPEACSTPGNGRDSRQVGPGRATRSGQDVAPKENFGGLRVEGVALYSQKVRHWEVRPLTRGIAASCPCPGDPNLVGLGGAERLGVVKAPNRAGPQREEL
ncbi:hypothetical protein P7K49_002019 [Saguinus oedipus]|uniref:Uncharacterized protein n=1 Tax=Saguinus oedipus TaxID=9490 RepID=A0ABQ9WG77_SAGOE|nr:hypothetical protein P7K49_002019 [Saguinus oedipus]